MNNVVFVVIFTIACICLFVSYVIFEVAIPVIKKIVKRSNE